MVPFFNRVLNDETFYSDSLMLSKPVDTVISLGLCGIVPCEVETKKDL